jgi:hypothetical protein
LENAQLRERFIARIWFVSHRIREAMRTRSLAAPLGGEGSICEADETFIGKIDGKEKPKGARGYAHKQAVLSLVERGGDVDDGVRAGKMVEGVVGNRLTYRNSTH